MLKSLLSKIFGGQRNGGASQPRAPKVFKPKIKSPFLNKYIGVVYFLLGWHVIGYLAFGYVDKRAKQEGKTIADVYGKNENTTIVEISRDFKFKVIDKNKPQNKADNTDAISNNTERNDSIESTDKKNN